MIIVFYGCTTRPFVRVLPDVDIETVGKTKTYRRRYAAAEIACGTESGVTNVPTFTLVSTHVRHAQGEKSYYGRQATNAQNIADAEQAISNALVTPHVLLKPQSRTASSGDDDDDDNSTPPCALPIIAVGDFNGPLKGVAVQPIYQAVVVASDVAESVPMSATSVANVATPTQVEQEQEANTPSSSPTLVGFCGLVRASPNRFVRRSTSGWNDLLIPTFSDGTMCRGVFCVLGA